MKIENLKNEDQETEAMELEEAQLEELEVAEAEEEEEGSHETKNEARIESLEVDLDEIEVFDHKVKSNNGSSNEASLIRVINTAKHGKRVQIKDELIDALGIEDTIEVGIIKDQLVLTKEGISSAKYNLKIQGKTHVIYHTQLVKDITEKCNLIFADKRTTVGFSSVEIVEKDGMKLAIARK